NKTSITVPSKANLEDVKVKSGEIEIRPDELADIKAEIKQLLNELAENPRTAKESVAIEIIKEEINDNPTLKHRLICASKALGFEGFKAIFNHPVISISVETVKGFLEAK
ncbi:MAG: hypothetical protein F6K38_39880, partial [Moorea sp. SIO3B2]|nr:hypothetical protein [Moorena sp. SIO3B2]